MLWILRSSWFMNFLQMAAGISDRSNQSDIRADRKVNVLYNSFPLFLLENFISLLFVSKKSRSCGETPPRHWSDLRSCHVFSRLLVLNFNVQMGLGRLSHPPPPPPPPPTKKHTHNRWFTARTLPFLSLSYCNALLLVMTFTSKGS